MNNFYAFLTVSSSRLHREVLSSYCCSPGHMELLHVDVQPIGVRVLAAIYTDTHAHTPALHVHVLRHSSKLYAVAA